MRPAVIAECAQGKFAGIEAAGIVRFAGIPYAKPPVGALRWRPSDPAAPHAGVRDAAGFAPICPQAPTPLQRLLGTAAGAQSEDCLYLNVWTPALSGKRPVMVWLHGGAFLFGGGSQVIYDGAMLAARDVVVVTLNYRLGAFGFANLHDATAGAIPARGTEGLSDQVLALEWVRANIAAFGGDADNVTLFGESAGAMSIGALLVSPCARGLFHKAILQSGGAHIGHDAERGLRQGRAFLSALGLTPGDAAKAYEAQPSALIAAQIAVQAAARGSHAATRLGSLPFQPSLDGGLVPQSPIGAVREGRAGGIAILTGTTLEEWRLFTGANPGARLTGAKGLAGRMEKAAGEQAAALMDAYAGLSNFDRLNAFMTDKMFAAPCIRLLEAQSAHAPVFAYRFDWKSKMLGGIMGACHAIELGFVFGTYRDRLLGQFFGQGPAADALSAEVMAAWTRFAREGTPGWAAYDSARRATMIFGDGPGRLDDDPGAARRRAWAAIADRRVGP